MTIGDERAEAMDRYVHGDEPKWDGFRADLEAAREENDELKRELDDAGKDYDVVLLEMRRLREEVEGMDQATLERVKQVSGERDKALAEVERLTTLLKDTQRALAAAQEVAIMNNPEGRIAELEERNEVLQTGNECIVREVNRLRAKLRSISWEANSALEKKHDG